MPVPALTVKELRLHLSFKACQVRIFPCASTAPLRGLHSVCAHHDVSQKPAHWRPQQQISSGGTVLLDFLLTLHGCRASTAAAGRTGTGVQWPRYPLVSRRAPCSPVHCISHPWCIYSQGTDVPGFTSRTQQAQRRLSFYRVALKESNGGCDESPGQ